VAGTNLCRYALKGDSVTADEREQNCVRVVLLRFVQKAFGVDATQGDESVHYDALSQSPENPRSSTVDLSWPDVVVAYQSPPPHTMVPYDPFEGSLQLQPRT
jgi:hypothetical protein